MRIRSDTQLSAPIESWRRASAFGLGAEGMRSVLPRGQGEARMSWGLSFPLVYLPSNFYAHYGIFDGGWCDEAVYNPENLRPQLWLFS